MKINLGKILRALSLSAVLLAGTAVTASGQGLTFVTHGMSSSGTEAWVQSIKNGISSKTSSWTTVAYDWKSGANTLLPNYALDNAYAAGKSAADALNFSQYNVIHFIAHSAGSRLVAEYAHELRLRGYDGIIQITYLDAYTPSLYNPDPPSSLSALNFLTQANTGANLTEHYYSTGDLPWTESPVPGATNRDVTTWDTFLGIPYETSDHSWPHDYYINTINNPNYDSGYGFPLAIEQSAFARMWVSVSSTTNLATIPTASGVMSGPFNWYSGTVSGQLQNFSAGFAISNSTSWSAPVMRDAALANADTITQKSGATLQLANGLIVSGTGAGTIAKWEMQGTAQITGTGVFRNNSGVVLKTGAGESVIGSGVGFYNNSGTVKVNAGALTISGSGENHNGTFTVENSARLNIGGRYELHGANRVTGSGTVSVSGGLVSGAAGDSLNVTGVLMIENSGTLRTTTLSVGSAGRVGVLGSVAANNITADGDFTINSGGVLNVGGLGGGFGVTTLTGALTLSSGALLAFDLGTNGLCDRLNLSDGTLLNLSGQSFSDFQFNPLTDIFATEGTYTYDLITGATNSLSGLSELTGQINGYNALLSLDEFNSLLQLQIHVIPEPSTILLLIAGLVALTLTVTIRRHIVSHRGTENMEL